MSQQPPKDIFHEMVEKRGRGVFLESHQILALSILIAIIPVYLGLFFSWGFFFTFFFGFSTLVVSWSILGSIFYKATPGYERVLEQLAYYEQRQFDEAEIDALYKSRFIEKHLFLGSYRHRRMRALLYGALWGGYLVFTVYMLATGRTLPEMIFLFSLFLFTWIIASLRLKNRYLPLLQKLQEVIESETRPQGAAGASRDPSGKPSRDPGSRAAAQSAAPAGDANSEPKEARAPTDFTI